MPTEDQTGAISEVVDAYLHDLARAYCDLDPRILETHAAPQEILEVRKKLRELAATGDRIEATLRQIEIESIDVFRDTTAWVSTVEVWDVVRIDAATGREKGAIPGSVQKSLVTVHLIDGAWKVTGRRVTRDESEAAESGTEGGGSET